MSNVSLQTVLCNNGFFSKDQTEEPPKLFSKTQWILRNNLAYLKHVFQRSSTSFESERLEQIVRSIRESQAHELFDTKAATYSRQPNSNIIGNGMHQFLNLKECACSVLDRVTKPGIRAEYEKQVLEKIDALAEVMTVIPISIFAPGMLFGEFVLLVKILNLLEEKTWKGELKLFFIDTEYTSTQAYTLLKSQKGKTPSTSVSDKVKILIDVHTMSMRKFDTEQGVFDDKASKAIHTFFDLLQQIAPTSIKIKSFFFEKMEDYITLAEQKPKFKNVLQIGSDIGNNRLKVIDLAKKTQSTDGAGMVVLVPRPVLNQNGEHEKTSDGLDKIEPMIIYMKTQAHEVEYNWLNNSLMTNRSSF